MYLTDIVFEPLHEDCKQEELLDAVGGYLVGLQRHWQIEGPHTIGWVGGVVRATVNLALPDALSDEFNSEYTSKDLVRLSELSQTPRWTVLEDSEKEARRQWKGERTLYLFTNLWNVHSPVCAGFDGRPIPPYLLPLSADQTERIYFWARDYRCHDRLQMACGTLEIPAYKELARSDALLSETGRSLCREIEEATRIPTFYYLMRYWGRREGEESRVCPSCGGAWKIQKKKKNSQGITEFDFRCDPCRLVSHIASSYEDERHARIGEYCKPKRKKV